MYVRLRERVAYDSKIKNSYTQYVNQIKDMCVCAVFKFR